MKIFDKILIFIILLFTFSNIVKADTFTTNVPNTSFTIANGGYFEMNFNNVFYGNGEGVLQFSVLTASGGITVVSARTSDNQQFNCIVDGNINTQNLTLYAITCPMNLSNGGLSKIRFTNHTATTTQVITGAKITYVNEFNYKILSAIQAQNYTEILNNIYNRLYTGFTDIYTQDQTFYNTITNIQNQIYSRMNNGFTDLYNALVNNSNLNQQQINKIQETNDKLDDLNDNLTSTDTSGASSKSNDMLNSVNSNLPSGLSGIITAPLRFINSMTSSCSPINFVLPVYNENVSIPCMSTGVYSKYPQLTATASVVINGLLVYRLIVMLFKLIKDFKDPESDRVEVVDL